MFFVENKNHSENGSKTVFGTKSTTKKYHLISSELLSYYCHHWCINVLANTWSKDCYKST